MTAAAAARVKRLLVVARQGWREHAACVHADPCLFDPPSAADKRLGVLQDRVEKARAICDTCPVFAQCVAAIEPGDRGVRAGRMLGGMRPQTDERWARTSHRPLAPCGTRSAHARHIRRREPIDDACRAADNAHTSARRAAKQHTASAKGQLDDHDPAGPQAQPDQTQQGQPAR